MNLKIKNLISEELIFALWFWEFSLLKPLVTSYENKSFFLLLMFTLCLFFISILKGVKISKAFMFIFIIFISILFKYIFNLNPIFFNILYNFIIYGVLSTYFFAQVKNIKLVLNYLCILSVIVFFISFRDPFNKYVLYVDYMGFGFLFSLPAAIFFKIGRKYLNKKYLIFLEIPTIFLLCMYSNRSTILSLIFFYFLEILFIERKTKTKIIKIFFILIFIILFFLFFKDIVSYLYHICNIYNLKIRVVGSLFHFYHNLVNLSISNNLDNLTTGRIEIWEKTIPIIKNNIFFGGGIGIFESIYGGYSHNLILDFLMQFGILGTFLFILFILISFINIIKYNYYEKIFGVALLALWFPRLMFSSSMYSVSYFWIFLYFGFCKFNYKKINKWRRNE